jgi:phosphoheptose isomerase
MSESKPQTSNIRFPNHPYDEIGSYTLDYFDLHHAASETLNISELTRASEVLTRCYQAGEWLFVCGNGGSAAIANHFVCDHLKLIATGTAIKPKVYSLSSNIEIQTAIANDISYDDVFAYQLGNLAANRDVLTVVSASGNSENVIRALATAKEIGMTTIAMTGFSGGTCRERADISLHFDCNNYGIVEDLHLCTMQILAQFIRNTAMTHEDILGHAF